MDGPVLFSEFSGRGRNTKFLSANRRSPRPVMVFFFKFFGKAWVNLPLLEDPIRKKNKRLSNQSFTHAIVSRNLVFREKLLYFPRNSK